MTDTTLRRHLTKSALDPNLIFLLEDIASACRAIANLVRNGAFEGNLGSADEINVQGETQKTLDILANDEFERICSNSPCLAALVSEEVEEVTWLKEPEAGDYLLYFDPLDGSSNLDVNLSVGSIFAIMQVQSDGDRNVLHEGRKQVCGISVATHGVQSDCIRDGLNLRVVNRDFQKLCNYPDCGRGIAFHVCIMHEQNVR